MGYKNISTINLSKSIIVLYVATCFPVKVLSIIRLPITRFKNYIIYLLSFGATWNHIALVFKILITYRKHASQDSQSIWMLHCIRHWTIRIVVENHVQLHGKARNNYRTRSIKTWSTKRFVGYIERAI